MVSGRRNAVRHYRRDLAIPYSCEMGQFTLAVRLETAPNVDTDSIAYAECWRAEEAELLTKHCHADVWAFKPTDEKSGSTHRLQVRCSGD
jgi:hypothetical protein